MKPVAFGYYRPNGVDTAIEKLLASDARAKILAGGQSLGPMMNLRLARPSELVDIGTLEALRGHRETAQSVLIGAGTTHADIEDGLVPDPINGHMARVASGIAYRVVRNKGTIGGSVAHADPAADWVNFLHVTNASVHVRGPIAVRVVPIHQFILAAYTTVLSPDEIITDIEIPKFGAQARFGYYKLCRKVGEFADAIGAALVDPGKRYCQITAGALGSKPVTLPTVAKRLANTATTPDVCAIKTDLLNVTSESDPVKLQMVAVAVRRAIQQALTK